MFRPDYLRPGTDRHPGVGLVYMGYGLCRHLKQQLTVLAASVNFLDGTKIEQQRILLAVYPLLCVTTQCDSAVCG